MARAHLITFPLYLCLKCVLFIEICAINFDVYPSVTVGARHPTSPNPSKMVGFSGGF
jgi:hypothetical protein